MQTGLKLFKKKLRSHLRFLRNRAQKDHLVVNAAQAEIQFDTSSQVAKQWFFPRYQTGQPHEAPVVSVIERKSTPSSCFLDIGANLGFYTVLASKLCTKGTVHAFEVDPDLVAEIRRNVILNQAGNVTVVCAAVWESNGRTFTFEPHQTKNKSTNMISESGNATCCRVPSLSMDTYCQQHEIRPDIAKIDVEGSEGKVLSGMRETLHEVRTLLLEVHPALLPNFGDSILNITDILADYEFSYTRIESHKRGQSKAYTVLPQDLVKVDENYMLVCEKR